MKRLIAKSKYDYDFNTMDAVDIYKLVLDGSIKRFPNGFWMNPESLQNAIKCVKYMIENILCWDDEQIKQNIRYTTFGEYKLKSVLTLVFHESVYEAINAVYPEKFKPWEFFYSPMNFWNEENGIKAIKWLIEEKLNWTPEQVKENLTFNTFIDNGLRGMMHQLYRDSPILALDAAYPGQYKMEEMIGYNKSNKYY